MQIFNAPGSSSGGSSIGSGGTTSTGSVVLTSASVGAQSITTTDFGQSVTLPDATTMSAIKGSNNFNVSNAGGYPLKVLDGASNILGYIYPGDSSMIGCSDASTTAGVWDCTGLEIAAITARIFSTTIFNLGAAIRTVALDSDRTLITMGLGATNLYGVVYTTSTASFGSLTLIRASASNHVTVKTAANQVLVCSCNATTGFEAVVLSISAATITVNTAATAVNAANIVSNGFTNLIAVGSAWVVSYTVATPANTMRAITISGTTPTVGNEASMTGTASIYVSLYAVSSSVYLTLSMTTNTGVYAKPFSLSGTSISAGTEASVTGLGSTAGLLTTSISSDARWVMLYLDGATTGTAASIVSVAGSVASLSTVDPLLLETSSVQNTAAAIVAGSKLIFFGSNSRTVNILTDTAGVATAGTAINLNCGAVSTTNTITANGNVAKALMGGSSKAALCVVNYSGASPVLTSAQNLTGIGNTPSVNQPYNGTRGMALMRGVQTFSVDQAGAITPVRLGVVSGNVLHAVWPKLDSEVPVNAAYRANVSAVGEIGVWIYGSATYTDAGVLLLIEGVT